jgi:hypothetical protein
LAGAFIFNFQFCQNLELCAAATGLDLLMGIGLVFAYFSWD